MAKVKYQVFISSTYDDLKEERDQVIKACLEMGHIPVGMEMFSAADEEQWQTITRQIDDCDYYVVIVANRYGSMVNGISHVEKEYNYAVSKGIPTIGFILDRKAIWPVNALEQNKKNKPKLEAFKRKLKSKPVTFWYNKEDLYAKFAIALLKTISIHTAQQANFSAKEDSHSGKSTNNAENEYINLSIPNEFVIPLQQYFLFFKEFTKVSKGSIVQIDINETVDGVGIRYKTEMSVTKQQVSDWCLEYINFFRHNQHRDTPVIDQIEVTTSVTSREIDILQLKLENQVGNLKNSLKIAHFENKSLKDEVFFLRQLSVALAAKDVKIQNQIISGGDQQFGDHIQNL